MFVLKAAAVKKSITTIYKKKKHKTAVEPHCQNDYCQLCLAGYHTINHAGD